MRITAGAIEQQIVVMRRSEMPGGLGVYFPAAVSVAAKIRAFRANAASGYAAVF
ncbi:MAG: hypothetical protein WA734_16545 [Candidatus Acidiferrales bacterium]